jgi:hypothetical protein
VGIPYVAGFQPAQSPLRERLHINVVIGTERCCSVYGFYIIRWLPNNRAKKSVLFLFCIEIRQRMGMPDMFLHPARNLQYSLVSGYANAPGGIRWRYKFRELRNYEFWKAAGTTG